MIYFLFHQVVFALGLRCSLAVTVYKVGVILISDPGVPYGVQRSGAAVQLAFENVNKEVLNSSFQLQPVLRTYGPACDAATAPGQSNQS